MSDSRPKRSRALPQRLREAVSQRKGKGTAGTSRQNRGKAPMEEEPRQGHPVPYFTEPHLLHEFNLVENSKPLVNPRFVDFAWLVTFSEMLSSLLGFTGLQHLLELKGCFYPNLTRAFYTAFRKHPDTQDITATLKGVEVTLTPDIWANVLGLKDEGLVANKVGLNHAGAEFNKTEVYRSFMKNPNERIGNRFSVRPLRLEFRVLHYILTWMVIPRGSNHAQVFEDDLILMWAIVNRQKVNWVHMIMDTMFKAKRLQESSLPYAAFLGRVFRIAGVPLDDEGYDTVGDENQLTDRHIKQMGYVKTDAGWREKNVPAAEEDEEAAAAAQADLPQPDERFLSNFERLMLSRMDSMSGRIDSLIEENRSHHADYERRFDDMAECYLSLSDRLDSLGAPYPEDSD